MIRFSHNTQRNSDYEVLFRRPQSAQQTIFCYCQQSRLDQRQLEYGGPLHPTTFIPCRHTPAVHGIKNGHLAHSAAMLHGPVPPAYVLRVPRTHAHSKYTRTLCLRGILRNRRARAPTPRSKVLLSSSSLQSKSMHTQFTTKAHPTPVNHHCDLHRSPNDGIANDKMKDTELREALRPPAEIVTVRRHSGNAAQTGSCAAFSNAATRTTAVRVVSCVVRLMASAAHSQDSSGADGGHEGARQRFWVLACGGIIGRPTLSTKRANTRRIIPGCNN